MAGGAKIAKNMLNFAAGLNESLRPVASKAGREALDANSRKAAQQVLNSSACQFGAKVGKKALNNTMTTGIASTIHNLDKGAGKVDFKEAIKAAHSVVDKSAPNGTRISKRKVAGTMATAGVAGRVATGGGLYRDRYGNVNIPGLPFI